MVKRFSEGPPITDVPPYSYSRKLPSMPEVTPDQEVILLKPEKDTFNSAVDSGRNLAREQKEMLEQMQIHFTPADVNVNKITRGGIRGRGKSSAIEGRETTSNSPQKRKRYMTCMMNTMISLMSQVKKSRKPVLIPPSSEPLEQPSNTPSPSVKSTITTICTADLASYLPIDVDEVNEYEAFSPEIGSPTRQILEREVVAIAKDEEVMESILPQLLGQDLPGTCSNLNVRHAISTTKPKTDDDSSHKSFI
ncbi:Hypothetical predicted protein [Mytilus galloprovincialis]|uniref:Uncharacterized protein n=1 Tax=Mytilus galloprovincialis TaxID=29158 RepID=A0A8B6F634_MYTGA|nr:Hypothetical predicted protein [Mytilus galloprovincialis]